MCYGIRLRHTFNEWRFTSVIKSNTRAQHYEMTLRCSHFSDNHLKSAIKFNPLTLSQLMANEMEKEY